MSTSKERAKKVLISKQILVVLAVLIQLVLLFLLVLAVNTKAPYVYWLMSVLSVFILLVVFDNDNMNPAYKILWVLMLTVLPVGGAIMYVLFGNSKLTPKRAARINRNETVSNAALVQQPAALERLTEHYPHYVPHAKYLTKATSSPVYTGTQAVYLPDGQTFFQHLCVELEKAQRFIFMEYFIIQQGTMWDTILEILRRKAAAGVDVRIVYDGFGCLPKLPQDYEKTLRSYGIDAHVFNPIRFNFHVSDYMFLNHRDHRKICVIDGNVGFNGGLNLADEYINEIEKFGYWKDTAYMLQGPAVFSLTVTFSKMYKLVTQKPFNYEKYMPTAAFPTTGLVQPFDDTPLDRQPVSELAYLNILNRAKRYVYICTPYLVIDNEMMTALRLAAQSGIDVRLVTPGIPDKKYVYAVTQSYYPYLLAGGVRIFEYAPGFMHAKMFLSDDDLAVVGSANMDYRSLYLHFESCGTFYGGSIIEDVKKDFGDIFAVSREVTMEQMRKRPLWKRLFQSLLRLFAPLM